MCSSTGTAVIPEFDDPDQRGLKLLRYQPFVNSLLITVMLFNCVYIFFKYFGQMLIKLSCLIF